jgi:DNA replication protein DnaC
MRKLPLTAAEDLLEIIMRRYEPASMLVTSIRPVEDWGKLLRDATVVSHARSLAASRLDIFLRQSENKSSLKSSEQVAGKSEKPSVPGHSHWPVLK